MHLKVKTHLVYWGIILQFFIVLSAFSQDTIWFSNGKKAVGKVLLINKGEVNFRKEALPNGPDFIYAKSKVTRIKFSNGHLELLELEPTDEDFLLPGEETKKSKPVFTHKKNSLWYNTVDLNVLRIGFTYERMIGKNNKNSIRIPLSASLRDIKAHLVFNDFSVNDNVVKATSYKLELGESNLGRIAGFLSFADEFSGNEFFNHFGNSFYTGIGFRHYANGLKDRNFYYGLSLEGGTFVYLFHEIDKAIPYSFGNPYYYRVTYKEIGKLGGMFRVLGEVGGRYNPTPHFSMSLGVAIGYVRLILPIDYSKKNLSPISINPSFSLGYNFGKTKEEE